MLPADLKAKAARIAGKRGLSLGELIREALEKVCLSNLKEMQDCFFSDTEVYTGKTPKNLAKHHDDYLYEDE
jgi:hypothetical protein